MQPSLALNHLFPSEIEDYPIENNGYSYNCWPWNAQEQTKSGTWVTGSTSQDDFRESEESAEDLVLHGVDEDQWYIDFVSIGYESGLLITFFKENLDFARVVFNEGRQRGDMIEDKDAADNSDTWSLEVNLDVGDSAI
jgi:hypothetical protein